MIGVLFYIRVKHMFVIFTKKMFDIFNDIFFFRRKEIWRTFLWFICILYNRFNNFTLYIGFGAIALWFKNICTIGEGDFSFLGHWVA